MSYTGNCEDMQLVLIFLQAIYSVQHEGNAFVSYQYNILSTNITGCWSTLPHPPPQMDSLHVHSYLAKEKHLTSWFVSLFKLIEQNKKI